MCCNISEMRAAFFVYVDYKINSDNEAGAVPIGV